MNTEDIAADLRRRIEAGRLPSDDRPPDALPPGSELPSVRSLAVALGVANETVHKAMRQLADGGLIHPRVSKPPIVADHRPLWIISGSTYDRHRREDPEGLTVFEQQTRRAGIEARTDHHCASVPSVPTWAAEFLGPRPDRSAVFLFGEGYAIPLDSAGRPDEASEYVAGIYDCFIPGDVAADVPQLLTERNDTVRDRWVGGVWSVVERALGVDLVAQTWHISGAMTTPAESARFGLQRSVPAMVEENCHADSSGRVYVATRMLKLFGTVRWELDLPVKIT